MKTCPILEAARRIEAHLSLLCYKNTGLFASSATQAECLGMECEWWSKCHTASKRTVIQSKV